MGDATFEKIGEQLMFGTCAGCGQSFETMKDYTDHKHEGGEQPDGADIIQFALTKLKLPIKGVVVRVDTKLRGVWVSDNGGVSWAYECSF